MNISSVILKARQCLVASFFILNIILYCILPKFASHDALIFFNKLILSSLNTQVVVHGNTDHLNRNNLLIMANHYEGFIDGNVLYNLYYKYNKTNKLYTIAKADLLSDPNSKNVFLKSFSCIKDAALNSMSLIPYKRGDKSDGIVVKNIIAEYLQDNKNIIVFPEGVARTNGVPRDFKTGIFALAVEEKMNILPITLKYKRDIGSERHEPLDFSKIFDCPVDVYIHELIDCTTEPCYQTKDYIALKDKTLKTILMGELAGPEPKRTAPEPKRTAPEPKRTADLPVPA